MYSGSDSTDSQNFAQWAMHPSAFQNMPKDSIDWAALAQQWIIMKEAGPPPMPEPRRAAPRGRAEGGEAPIGAEVGKGAPAWGGGGHAQPQPPGAEPWGWGAAQQPPGWAWNTTWPPGGGGGSAAAPNCPPPPIVKPPLLPTPANHVQFTSSPPSAPVDGADSSAQFSGYNSTPSNDYQQGYWTSSPTHPPPKQVSIKPHNRKYSKVNVPTVQRNLPPATVPATLAPLDAAKRKTLPAWIREGLEKMERDKLKQMEREKQKQGKDGDKEKVKLDEKETMEILKNTIQERRKSRFESDGESDEEIHGKRIREESPEPVPLTHDELMLKVRKTMTEILLKVTNREIEAVCREELQRHLKKSKASDQRLSAPTGANMSANLGLGMYGGDSGSSDGSDDDSQYERKDSDLELKESIRRRKADFIRTERDIEGRIAQNDRRGGNGESRSSTPDTNDNDSQVEPKYQVAGRNRSRSHDSPETTPQQHSRSYHEDSRYSGRSPSRSDTGSDSEYGGGGGGGGGSSRSPVRRSSSSGSTAATRRTDSPAQTQQQSGNDRRSHRSHQDKGGSGAGGGSASASKGATGRRSRSRSTGRRRRTSRSTSRTRRDSRGYRRSRSSSYSRSSRRSRSSSSYRRSSDSRRRSSRRSRSRSRSRSSRRQRQRSDSRGGHTRSRRSRSHGRRSHRHRSRSSSGGGGGGGGGKRHRD